MEPRSRDPDEIDCQIGSYRLVEPLGHGGMGVVWLAEHTLLGKRAAIKTLSPAHATNAELVTRFFNEARAAAAITDPGIIQIYDFGYHTDGSAYIVMELLEGETLNSRIERTGVMSIGDALRTMRQVASSLGAAHACNITHRDLSPRNIFLVHDPEVPGGERAKIFDFGIAKLSGDPYAHKTQTQTLMGTPYFMSPEQCRGGQLVDARSDVYALGCVLYNMVIGEPPFDAPGVGDIIAKHMFEAPPRASSRARGVPRELDDLIARCMAKDPAQRYANASEVAVAIGTMLKRASIAMAPHVVATAPAAGVTMMAIPPKQTTLSGSASQMGLEDELELDRAARLRRLVSTVAVIGIVGFGGGAAYLALRSDATTTTASAPAAVTAPPADVAPAKPDARPEQARTKLGRVLDGFVRWSAAHASEPCPSRVDLAPFMDGDTIDPWGNPFAITCTDQPADQIIGVISLGPDGALGTADDITSWSLGRDDVKGARWHAKPVAVAPAPAKPHRPTARPAAPAKAEPASKAPEVVTPPPPPPPPPADPNGPTFKGTTLGDDGIPTSR